MRKSLKIKKGLMSCLFDWLSLKKNNLTYCVVGVKIS